jgi:hypothetical protein
VIIAAGVTAVALSRVTGRRRQVAGRPILGVLVSTFELQPEVGGAPIATPWPASCRSGELWVLDPAGITGPRSAWRHRGA